MYVWKWNEHGENKYINKLFVSLNALHHSAREKHIILLHIHLLTYLSVSSTCVLISHHCDKSLPVDFRQTTNISSFYINNLYMKFFHSIAHSKFKFFHSLSLSLPFFLSSFISISLCAVPYIVIDDDRGVATPEKFYKVGSTIELKCIIDKIPNRSSYVLWKHGERMLNYDTSRGGIR